MIHETIGQVGHALVIVSFVTALLATYAYFRSSQEESLANDWRQTARTLFIVHLAAVIAVATTLYIIIYNHYFEYHYAFSHASKALPIAYIVSCFWEGQEGSFLLWIFWQALLGILLMFRNPKWESPVMTVFALVQTFLTSMILGVIIPGCLLYTSDAADD